MAHFAQVKNGVVTQVIVAEQNFINTLPDSSDWVQTSYRTSGGQHPEGRPLRKNYAGIGFLYDGVGFYPPKPYDSWSLNQDTYVWEAPTPYPDTGRLYKWNEDTLSWDEIPTPV
jgi:hypothetical protein